MAKLLILVNFVLSSVVLPTMQWGWYGFIGGRVPLVDKIIGRNLMFFGASWLLIIFVSFLWLMFEPKNRWRKAPASSSLLLVALLIAIGFGGMIVMQRGAMLTLATIF